MGKWSVQDAKNRFSAMLDAARSKPQVVTKHGKPTVVVLDVAEYERLRQQRQGRRPSFTEFLLSIPPGEDDFERIDIKPSGVES
jgi:prevent-host-death family protein